MTVISLTITPSTRQLVSGIPESITITTNVPAMIFYTLDGSNPDLSSEVYTGAINLPTNLPSVNFKAFATDGTLSSSTVDLTYAPNLTSARFPHSVATRINEIARPAPGTTGGIPKYIFSQPASYTIDAANVSPTYFDGYGTDPSIYPVISLDAQPPSYLVKKSDSDVHGRIGAGIGTLPKVSVLYLPPPPESTEVNDGDYDKNAKVIYHDGTQPNENRHEIFRQFFDTQNFEKVAYGGKYYGVAFNDGDFFPTGSFLKYYYNPKDHTINFYYMDPKTLTWIISKEPYPNPEKNNSPLINGEPMSPNTGYGHVYKWMLFSRSSY